MYKYLLPSLLIIIIGCSEPNISNTILNNTWYSIDEYGKLGSFEFKKESIIITKIRDCSDNSSPDDSLSISVPNESTILFINPQTQEKRGVIINSITENSFIMSSPNQPNFTFFSDCSIVN